MISTATSKTKKPNLRFDFDQMVESFKTVSFRKSFENGIFELENKLVKADSEAFWNKLTKLKK